MPCKPLNNTKTLGRHHPGGAIDRTCLLLLLVLLPNPGSGIGKGSNGGNSSGSGATPGAHTSSLKATTFS